MYVFTQVPEITNYTMVNRTYRYFEGVPLFPFGYGLYVSFDSLVYLIAVNLIIDITVAHTLPSSTLI